MIGVSLPLHPRWFLLMYFIYFQIRRGKILLANLLMAATIIIARYWESTIIPSLIEWVSKVKYACLGNLSVVSKYRLGNTKGLGTFSSQWRGFVNSKYNKFVPQTVRSLLLDMM